MLLNVQGPQVNKQVIKRTRPTILVIFGLYSKVIVEPICHFNRAQIFYPGD